MSHGCWTCRNRKVRCDLKVPKCSNCSQTRRQCLGYGLRLAWPRTGNKRRAIVYAPSPTNHAATGHKPFRNIFLVNVLSKDVRLCYELSGSRALRHLSSSQLPTSTTTWTSDDEVETLFKTRVLPMSKPVSWDLIDEPGKLILNYYINSGSQLFAPLQGDNLAPLLLKIAMSDTSTSSKAVLHAILALSSLHLHQYAEASAYRASAISLLSASLKAGSEAKVAFENIVSSMLLCVFEICHVSDTYVNWTLYLCGVKKIILDGLAQRRIDDQECITLKDWIYFYEVLARFGLLHWNCRPKRYAICYQPTSNLIQITSNQSSPDDVCAIGYSREVFDCISAITNTLLRSKVLSCTSLDHQRHVNEIERRLRFFKENTARHNRGSLSETQSKASTIVYLYLLAAFIYFKRTVLHYSGGEPQYTILVEEALTHLTQVQVWEAPWPYFIIGCEAQTDSQRMLVLQRSQKLQTSGRLDNAMWMQRMVEASWTQDDLDTEQSLNYVDKISAVISTSPFLPVFA